MASQSTPPPDVLFPRWLVVVRRDLNTLYENLMLTFRSSDRVDVLVDRRQDDVYGTPAPIKSERRRRITARERALWRHVGFRLIYIGGEPVDAGREARRPGVGHRRRRVGGAIPR